MDSPDKSIIDSLETFKDLFDNAYDLIHIVHPDGTIIYVNNAWEKHLEYSQKEVQGQSIYLLVYSEDRDRFKNYRSNVITGKSLDNNIEVRMQSKSGKLITIEGVLSVRNLSGKTLYTRGIFRDITKRIENESKLRLLNETLIEREGNLQQLLSHAPDAVIVIDKQSIINYWNPKAEELFGWSQHEALGKKLTDTIIPLQYREAHNKGMNRYLSTGQAHVLNQSLELTALNKDGNEFYISLTISTTIQNHDLAFIAFIRNIDKEKKNELELDKKRKELEQSNKELEQFAYVTSHDLQEPLRKIQVFNDIIIDRFSEHLNEEIKIYLQKSTDAAYRMTSLIRNLLDYSRISRGTLIFEKIDLNNVLKEVEKDLEIIISEKKATIQSENLPIIQGIPLQIQQLFYNLVNNSLKFSKKHVRPLLKISSRILLPDELEPYSLLNKKKEYVMIEFQDNGIGFNQDYADKIFTIFQQLNERSSYSGYGIGLAICQKVVQNHKGIIFAKGIEQQGANFTLILPLNKD